MGNAEYMGSLVLVVVARGSSDPLATHTKAMLTSRDAIYP